MMEKRVKSRFSHQIITLNSSLKEIDFINKLKFNLSL